MNTNFVSCNAVMRRDCENENQYEVSLRDET